ncbi:MAG: DUF5658 family protein [Acidobacteriota bacterium]|nr:DUF5658 family protein [Acidobacteriota bacterium]
MKLSQQTLLLFGLNFMDAVLTIYWVHNGYASEGNQLMAGLLDIGYAPFFCVKVAIGAVAAIVFWYFGNLKVARGGLSLVLVIYSSLMVVHIVTGLSASGLVSETAINEFSFWSNSFLAFFN